MRAGFAFCSFEGMKRAHALSKVSVGEEFIAGEFNGPDFILDAFINMKTDDKRAGRGINELDIFDFKIDVAVIPIKLLEFFLIVLELFVFEHTTAGNPGKHPMAPGLNNFTEFFLFKGFGADKLDIHHTNFWAFGDL